MCRRESRIIECRPAREGGGDRVTNTPYDIMVQREILLDVVEGDAAPTPVGNMLAFWDLALFSDVPQ